MYIPDSFDYQERLYIRKCFFGCIEEVHTAIFTPIRAIFKLLSAEFTESRGWWEAYYGNGIIIALTPQGSPIIDAISALEPGTQLTFLGLAGSVNTLEIGCIIEPETAKMGNDISYRNFSEKRSFTDARIATISSIAEGWQQQEYFSKVADCVDMETAIIFRTAVHQKKFARSVLIISDCGREYPIFSTSLSEISSSIEEVAKFTYNYLQNRKSTH